LKNQFEAAQENKIEDKDIQQLNSAVKTIDKRLELDYVNKHECMKNIKRVLDKM